MRQCVFLFVALLLFSCTPKFDLGDAVFEPQIVVEGWIESGGVANVCLSQSMPLVDGADSISLADVPIRWAKVSVSDGETEEVLVGRMDDDYNPPFVYRGVRIKGEAGKSYTLTVEYSGRKLTAVTTIPPVVEIESLEVSRCSDSDTLYQIHLSFSDDPAGRNYYKIFTQALPDETRFYSSFMGTVSDEVLDDNHAKIKANRGTRFGMKKYTPYYKIGDTVLVKLTQLSYEGFRFWSDYENEVMNGKNPLFPSTTNLHSNINGGKGIWCGYGRDVETVIIRDCIPLH